MSTGFIQHPRTFTKSVSTGTYKITHFKIYHGMQLYKKLVRATCLSGRVLSVPTFFVYLSIVIPYSTPGLWGVIMAQREKLPWAGGFCTEQ